MEYTFNQETKTYEIKEFNHTLEECKKFISNFALLDLIIQNDSDKKAVKNSRTLIRKKLDEVSTVRKTLNEVVMGRFNEQTKEIESLLKETDAQLKAKIDEYEKKIGKPELFSIVIKSYDKKKIEKVRAYALKLEMEVK